ncbi:MAG TPA: FABP family protein [Mycobacteriales bacterium]|nr:FABP family protein [Mycobacteriales bacterium]
MPAADLHPSLVPLAFLLGSWRGEGVGGYPTMADFRYGEESDFWHEGKPVLHYRQRTWRLDDLTPSHAEAGYWRPQPDGSLEVVLAHPTGVAEIYVGTIEGTRISLTTDVVVRTSSAKEVASLTRLYGLVEGKLLYAVDMAAVGQPLQPHLSATLERAPGQEPTGVTAKSDTGSPI